MQDETPSDAPLFNENDKENYINQIDFFEKDHNDTRPKVLMIHGYGATGATFYGLARYLRQHFRLTAIDLMGMGASGRPKFELKTAQQCIDYYHLSIEAWMKTVNYKDEDYILLGHSLGGYLSI